MTKKQYREERELFRKAMIEGMARKYDQELDQYSEEVTCSENHLQKMSAIVQAHAISERRKAVKQKVVAALVAAALLALTACTVYANREEIKKLFVKVFDSHFLLSYEEEELGNDKSLAERYTLGYVPSGYTIESEQQTVLVNKSTWIDQQNNRIVLRQSSWDGTSYSVDSEAGESLAYVFNGIEVYYRLNDAHTYIWNDGIYSFILASTESFSEMELRSMIEGLIVVD